MAAWSIPQGSLASKKRLLRSSTAYFPNSSNGDSRIFMLTVAQLAPLKDRDPYLYETLVKIVASLNATSQRAGLDPSTPPPAPSPIASVTVQAANGWFDISITDPSDARPGLFYFAESDTTPAVG